MLLLSLGLNCAGRKLAQLYRQVERKMALETKGGCNEMQPNSSQWVWWVSAYKTTWYHNPEDNMKNHCRENPKTNNINTLHFCSIYLKKVSVNGIIYRNISS